MTETASPRVIAAAALTQEAFAPFGEVVSHRGANMRHYLERPFERSAQAEHPKLWVSSASTPKLFPLRIERVERHPYSAQTFIPLAVSRYLVVVAPDAEDGRPDASRAQAFIAAQGQGVCYGRGVWHHGLTVLDAPAEFAVLMSVRGEGDDEFVDLIEPLQVGDTDGSMGARA